MERHGRHQRGECRPDRAWRWRHHADRRLRGGDTLTSGGADILIAGTTSYDTNLAALQTILNTWKTATATNYLSVISTIEDSSFAAALNASTVHDAGSSDLADTLNAKATSDVDWFFAHQSGGANPNDLVNALGHFQITSI